jgi:hypothetical protein
MAVMMSESGTEWDFFQATRPGVQPLSADRNVAPCPATANWAATVVKRAAPGWTGSGTLAGSPRGSGTLSGSGVIRPRDTKAPLGSTWDHALAFAYPGTLARTVAWPASTTDGRCTDTSACVPMGARFQIDPAINCTTWPTLTAEWQRQMCRTLQKYGMIVIDTGSALIAQNPVSLGSYVYPWVPQWARLPLDLATHLRLIDWTRWTGR